MLGVNRRKEYGDTIVEVLFAVAIFSFAAIGGMMVMNQGSATAQRALEISLVREQIDAQAEGLRYLNSSYITAYRPGATYLASTAAGQWDSIHGLAVDKASDFGGSCPVSPGSNWFILNTRTAKVVSLDSSSWSRASTFSQVKYNTSIPSDPLSDTIFYRSEGIWVEAVSYPYPPGVASNTAYIDFHIRACWDSLGQSTPVTLGTIVRLYEPRS